MVPTEALTADMAEVLKYTTLKAFKLKFNCMAASVYTICSPVTSVHSLIVAGIVQDVRDGTLIEMSIEIKWSLIDQSLMI
jgi:hypothetical protein